MLPPGRSAAVHFAVAAESISNRASAGSELGFPPKPNVDATGPKNDNWVRGVVANMTEEDSGIPDKRIKSRGTQPITGFEMELIRRIMAKYEAKYGVERARELAGPAFISSSELALRSKTQDTA